jgi:hypothetical protein
MQSLVAPRGISERGKGIKGFKLACFHGFEPAIKVFSGTLAYHTEKLFYQMVGLLNSWAGLPDRPQALPLFFL